MSSQGLPFGSGQPVQPLVPARDGLSLSQQTPTTHSSAYSEMALHDAYLLLTEEDRKHLILFYNSTSW